MDEIMASVKASYMKQYENARPLATQDEMDAAWERSEEDLRRTMKSCSDNPSVLR